MEKTLSEQTSIINVHDISLATTSGAVAGTTSGTTSDMYITITVCCDVVASESYEFFILAIQWNFRDISLAR